MLKTKLYLAVLLIAMASLAAQVPVANISGRVLAPGGGPASEAIVSLIPRDRETGLLGSVQRTAQTNAQGGFALSGVPPGLYVLVANLSQDSREYWSEQRIEIADSNLTGLQLQLGGPLSLAGKVSTAGGTGIPFQGVSVRLLPEDGNSPEADGEVTKDGRLSLTNLRRTSYRMQVAGLPDGWYLQSAVLGSQKVLDDGLKLTQDSEAGDSLEITISSGACQVRGIVLDPEFHDLVPHALVKLFPEPVNPHRADLFRTVETDGSGRFVVKNMVPGKYRILAINGKTGWDNNYDDSRIAAASGTRLKLSEKQTKNLELELFEAHR